MNFFIAVFTRLLLHVLFRLKTIINKKTLINCITRIVKIKRVTLTVGFAISAVDGPVVIAMIVDVAVSVE